MIWSRRRRTSQLVAGRPHADGDLSLLELRCLPLHVKPSSSRSVSNALACHMLNALVVLGIHMAFVGLCFSGCLLRKRYLGGTTAYVTTVSSLNMSLKSGCIFFKTTTYCTLSTTESCCYSTQTIVMVKVVIHLRSSPMTFCFLFFQLQPSAGTCCTVQEFSSRTPTLSFLLAVDVPTQYQSGCVFH